MTGLLLFGWAVLILISYGISVAVLKKLDL